MQWMECCWTVLTVSGRNVSQNNTKMCCITFNYNVIQFDVSTLHLKWMNEWRTQWRHSFNRKSNRIWENYFIIIILTNTIQQLNRMGKKCNLENNSLYLAHSIALYSSSYSPIAWNSVWIDVLGYIKFEAFQLFLTQKWTITRVNSIVERLTKWMFLF